MINESEIQAEIESRFKMPEGGYDINGIREFINGIEAAKKLHADEWKTFGLDNFIEGLKWAHEKLNPPE